MNEAVGRVPRLISTTVSEPIRVVYLCKNTVSGWLKLYVGTYVEFNYYVSEPIEAVGYT